MVEIIKRVIRNADANHALPIVPLTESQS
jgi:hypothetical protein